jgi:hypothetical protein
MKRLLIIGLTIILGIGSLTTVASADQNWLGDRRSNSSSDHHKETTSLAPIPEPLRYRVERRSENMKPETRQINRWQRVNRYRKSHRHHPEYYRYYNSDSRNDPGRQ